MPAAGEDAHHRDEHRAGEHCQHAADHRCGGVALPDQEGAVRTLPAALRVSLDEEEPGRAEAGEDVRERDEPALARAGEAACRIREQEVDEDGREEARERRAEREDERLVRLRQRTEEPDEAEGDHEPPRRVVGRAGAGDETRGDERPAEEQSEHERRHRAVLVVRRKDERDPDRSHDKRRGPVREP